MRKTDEDIRDSRLTTLLHSSSTLLLLHPSLSNTVPRNRKEWLCMCTALRFIAVFFSRFCTHSQVGIQGNVRKALLWYSLFLPLISSCTFSFSVQKRKNNCRSRIAWLPFPLLEIVTRDDKCRILAVDNNICSQGTKRHNSKVWATCWSSQVGLSIELEDTGEQPRVVEQGETYHIPAL